MISSIGSTSFSSAYLQNLQNKKEAVNFSDLDTTNGKSVEMSQDFYEAHKDEMIAFDTNSTGDKQLTDDEKNSLSQKYDVTNMTENRQLQLFGKLTVMGVVSFSDFAKLRMQSLPISTPKSADSSVTTVSKLKSYQENQNYNWINMRLNYAQNEMIDGKYTSDGEFDLKIANILQQFT